MSDPVDSNTVISVPKKRGRPAKVQVPIDPNAPIVPKRGRGRPKKVVNLDPSIPTAGPGFTKEENDKIMSDLDSVSPVVRSTSNQER